MQVQSKQLPANSQNLMILLTCIVSYPVAPCRILDCLGHYWASYRKWKRGGKKKREEVGSHLGSREKNNANTFSHEIKPSTSIYLLSLFFFFCRNCALPKTFLFWPQKGHQHGRHIHFSLKYILRLLSHIFVVKCIHAPKYCSIVFFFHSTSLEILYCQSLRLS